MRVRTTLISSGLALSALLLAQTAHAAIAAPPAGQVVLVSEDEGLIAYDSSGAQHIIIQTLHSDLDKSEWVNGPPCFAPAGSLSGKFVEADDNAHDGLRQGVDDFDGDAYPFFGVFDASGARDFDSSIGTKGRIGADAAMQDPAGCAFDAAGNLFGIDVGENHLPLGSELQPITENFMSGRPGQLVEFFAPDYKTFCTIASDLSQPGMVTFDDNGGLLVPEAGFGQILRFSNFPSASGASCASGVSRDVWLAGQIGTPIGITHAPGGGYAVSSVLVPPTVFHVAATPAGGVVDGLYAVPDLDNTGTPFGLAFDATGNLYYADLGIRPFPLDGNDPTDPIDSTTDLSGFFVVPAGPGPVVTPQAPQRIAGGWQFADGVTVTAASNISW